MILKTICNDNDMYETQKKERLRAMKTVQTVTGEAPISQLGHCQMHEHLFVAEGPATRKNPAPHFYAPTHWLFSASRSALTDFFIDELRNGCVENREVRPGAVKAAVGPEGLVGAAAERYRAAAEAAARAEVPLVVHTEKGLDGVRAVELACACGMPIHRVLICHADRQADDFSVHDAIGRRRTLRPTRPLPTPARCWNTTPSAGSNITTTRPSAG